MSTTLAPRRIELRALIEEARRRARQRRLALTAIIVAATAGIAAGLTLTGGSATRVDAPPGFTVVKAKGQVAHTVIEYSSVVRITSLSGRDRPAKMTEEVWYDARGGLWRDVVRVDGRVRNDRAGTCAVSRKEPPCGEIPPLSYLRPFEWPPSKAGLHVTGTGTFRGRPVVWLEPKGGLGVSTPSNQVTPQIGLDRRTHRLVVQRYFSGGRQIGDETAISQQANLPAGSFSFVVRKHAAGGTPQAFERVTGHLLAYGLPAARRALGRNPLWLGPRFHGYLLRSVQSGTYPFGTTKTGALRRAPFVRFYYGTSVDEDYVFSVEEFGSIRPYFYKQGPRAGSIERDVGGTLMARMTSEGLLLRIMSSSLQFRFTRANALAIARALRPLPPGLKTVPTLRQQ
jgi:hypothetical protein